MSVERIESYDDILKVILKPTKNFQVGMNYFYCDSDVNTLNLINSYSWCLQQQGKYTRVITHLGGKYGSPLLFHREYAHNILGSYPAYIDHINGVAIDNTDNNLNSVNQQQNGYNRPSRGYTFNARRLTFRPQITFNEETLRPYGVVKTEFEACILQHQAETDYLELKMKHKYYIYYFLLDRRNDLDILDLERTKQISAEEATYRHVLRHAKDNAWYYYRYGLRDYFSQYHIPIPKYSLDTNGFMIHPITGQKLCPF